MIYEVSGDILKTKAQAIAHGIAPNDPFNQGLAMALRQQWPAMYKDFRHFCHQSHPNPGDIWLWGGVGGTRIINLMTQEGAYDHGSRPGKAEVKHVNHALRALHKAILDEGFTSIAIPRLATGVGGLTWEEVYPLIQQHLSDLEIPIYVYTEFHPGQEAEEPGL
ncbi:MAG: Appr-1-p processing protein [Myxococcales bacterium]|nr:Appr-1-p processing protein [Myxococcales bacterium]MCB9643954.1 Appr-1-p processing protein [Myxococcales bacterium]